MDSLCGTFSQFQSGPKPELAEFGNRAATTRSITAIAAHRTSAMRSRWLIGAYGQIIFLRYHIVDDGCIIPKLGAECRFGSKADIATVRLKCPLYPQKQTLRAAAICLVIRSPCQRAEALSVGPNAFALDEFYARSACHRILMFFICV